MDTSMSYETLIAAAGSVVIEPRGISMLPFLKEVRDSVRLVSPTAAPRKSLRRATVRPASRAAPNNNR